MKRVKSTLTELYKHYKLKSDKEKDQNTPVASSSTPHTCVASRLKVDIESGFGKYMEKREGIKNTEVDIYLRDGTERRDDKFDVLGWWKQNSEKFPILSQVARHVLAMPISTVASESAFSTGGWVIDKFRSSLTPKTAEALICTQDWLRSTLADVENMQVNGQQLEDLVENLAKIELEDTLRRVNIARSFQVREAVEAFRARVTWGVTSKVIGNHGDEVQNKVKAKQTQYNELISMRDEEQANGTAADERYKEANREAEKAVVRTKGKGEKTKEYFFALFNGQRREQPEEVESKGDNDGWIRVNRNKAKRFKDHTGRQDEMTDQFRSNISTGNHNFSSLEKISTPVYITNLPWKATTKEVWVECEKWGTVVDVFISSKTSMAGARFGFVRFIRVRDVVNLISNIRTIWMGSFHLYADVARKERE
ncbi:zinc finger BED domain-containing protein RICESLEEPER 2-like protein [Tanacetum coccineum]